MMAAIITIKMVALPLDWSSLNWRSRLRAWSRAALRSLAGQEYNILVADAKISIFLEKRASHVSNDFT